MKIANTPSQLKKCDQKGSCWKKIIENGGKSFCSHPITFSDGWYCWLEGRNLKEEPRHGRYIQRREM